MDLLSQKLDPLEFDDGCGMKGIVQGDLWFSEIRI